jgi:metal-sulfur cluster biosynthetic enzyme
MDPELHKSLIELIMVRQVRIEDGEAQRSTLMQEHSSR